MRVSDNLLFKTYLNNFNTSKEIMSKLQTDIATRSKINSPSDSPTGINRLFKLNSQLDSNTTYIENIDNSLSFAKSTDASLQVVSDSVRRIMETMYEMQNPIVSMDTAHYADKLDAELKNLLEAANMQYDGKYLFGGTDFSTKPYELSTGNNTVDRMVENTGEQKVTISKSISQKINMSGQEVFGVVNKHTGNIDPSLASTNKTNTVYDANGTAYDFKVTYTKNTGEGASNSYNMDYEIFSKDASPVSVFGPLTKEVKFYASTGTVESIDGKSPGQIRVNNSLPPIDFVFDMTAITNKTGSNTVNASQNQKRDVFNSLNTIIKNLRNGQKPSQDEFNVILDFDKHVINKMADNGNIIHSLDMVTNLLDSQSTELKKLISLEKDTDVAKSIMELNSQETTMNTLYKMSSMVLPKSLLDYM